MTAPATIPFTSPHPEKQPWTPSHRDRLIFQWVTFDGHTQSWVASQLNLDQSTVSRIVDRYHRWIARGGPASHGAPSHDERLRAQHWLTYERNEWILAAALRIAGEMERSIDTSKSVVSHPFARPSQETHVRTEHKTIDRSGIACRFLRLAHRINMDQKKLVEQEPLPPLEPLTVDDLGENAFPALAQTPNHQPTASDSAELDSDSAALKTENRKLNSDMHPVHNPLTSESTSTPAGAETSGENRPPEKTSPPAYPGAPRPPESAVSADTNAFPSPLPAVLTADHPVPT